jgi:hypothetical protein
MAPPTNGSSGFELIELFELLVAGISKIGVTLSSEHDDNSAESAAVKHNFENRRYTMYLNIYSKYRISFYFCFGFIFEVIHLTKMAI